MLDAKQVGARQECQRGTDNDTHILQSLTHRTQLGLVTEWTAEQPMGKTGVTHGLATQQQIVLSAFFKHAAYLVDSTMGIGGQEERALL